jgi:hypothetical protein
MTGRRTTNLTSLSLYSRTKKDEDREVEFSNNRREMNREGKSREEETLETLYKKV